MSKASEDYLVEKGKLPLASLVSGLAAITGCSALLWTQISRCASLVTTIWEKGRLVESTVLLNNLEAELLELCLSSVLLMAFLILLCGLFVSKWSLHMGLLLPRKGRLWKFRVSILNQILRILGAALTVGVLFLLFVTPLLSFLRLPTQEIPGALSGELSRFLPLLLLVAGVGLVVSTLLGRLWYRWSIDDDFE